MIFGITKLLIVLNQINILSVAKVSVRYNGDLKSENITVKNSVTEKSLIPRDTSE